MSHVAITLPVHVLVAYRSLSSSLLMPWSPLKPSESVWSSEDLTNTRELSFVILGLSSARFCWVCRLIELIMESKYSPDFSTNSEILAESTDSATAGSSPAGKDNQIEAGNAGDWPLYRAWRVWGCESHAPAPAPAVAERSLPFPLPTSRPRLARPPITANLAARFSSASRW